MENKLQQLTQKLYDEGLEKGRAEADRLVAELTPPGGNRPDDEEIDEEEEGPEQEATEPEQKATEPGNNRNGAEKHREAKGEAPDNRPE